MRQNIFVFKSLLTMPSYVLPLYHKQNFLRIIWIFTEGKGDRMESRLPFKIFFTLMDIKPQPKKLTTPLNKLPGHMWSKFVAEIRQFFLKKSQNQLTFFKSKIFGWLWFVIRKSSNEIIVSFQSSVNNFKGQIISECPYEIIHSPKIPKKKFPRFLP